VIEIGSLTSGHSEIVSADVRQAPISAETLCELYAGRVCRFATLVAGSDIEIEDIAQTALERALRKLPQFDPSRGSLDAWLWKIVVSVARDAGRSVRRRRLLFDRLVWYHAGEKVQDDIPLGIDNDRLLAALRALTALQRSVLALRYGADLEYSTVGSTLGMSRTAAAVAGHRALKVLRHKLMEDTDERTP
jgi:RNA polymerase sigma-70 factor (ECF subfamily)